MQHEVLRLTSKGEFRKIIGGSYDDLDEAMQRRARLQHSGAFIVLTETHKGYRVLRNDDRHYALILDGNTGPDVTDPGHYLAMLYITAGGQDTYCASKTYKTYKGAAKKVHDYLDVEDN